MRSLGGLAVAHTSQALTSPGLQSGKTGSTSSLQAHLRSQKAPHHCSAGLCRTPSVLYHCDIAILLQVVHGRPFFDREVEQASLIS